jgi:hypothetical protein
MYTRLRRGAGRPAPTSIEVVSACADATQNWQSGSYPSHTNLLPVFLLLPRQHRVPLMVLYISRGVGQDAEQKLPFLLAPRRERKAFP